ACVAMDEASNGVGDGDPGLTSQGAMLDQADDVNGNQEAHDEDEPEGLGKTVKKGITKAVNIVTGCVQDSGDNTETSPDLPTVQPHSNSDVYDFTHPKRGRAVIINNENFQKCSGFDSRPGSGNDARALVEVFEKLGFDVKRYNDLTAEQMRMKLKKAAKSYDHEKADCLAVAIMSHGDQEHLEKAWKQKRDTKVRRDLIFGVDGSSIPTEYIMRIFQDSHCRGLRGKPRLFFLQACRGGEFVEGVDIGVVHEKDKTDGDSTQPKEPVPVSVPASVPEAMAAADTTKSAGGDDVEEKDARPVPDEESYEGEEEDNPDARGETFEISPAPIFKDFLVMYATTPGHFAWRRATGSWFVQSLHSVFTKHYTRHMSLTQALTSVNRMVAHGYEAKGTKNATYNRKKQMPVIQSMLVKDVYFSPKK
ncbi:hypothetical protein BaRGS_00007259, partial [Batillaria attramentaria]